MTTASEAPPSRPSPARIYDYYRGGTENFPIDREAAEQAIRAFPNVATVARQNSAFMVRTIRYLTGTAGISQFLDLGTGIPTSPNPHQTAQAVIPAARLVYVDNDPDVFAHARLTGTPEGRVTFIATDLREGTGLLDRPEVRDTLDLSRPVALSVLAVMHQIHDDDDPYGIVRGLMDALPSGSYLSVTQATADYDPDNAKLLQEVYRQRGIPFELRGKAEFNRFFDGLELVPPGVQIMHRWRPDEDTPTELTDAQISVYGALAIKR
jgi:hypothetical protein